MLSAVQLKAIHESGIKTRKDVQARINKELKRVCKLKDCDNSLAFERKDRIFCSRGHSVQYNTYKETGIVPGYKPSKDAIKAKKWREKKKKERIELLQVS